MRLSYSAISTYELCPAKYRFQYEERLPTTTSPALAFGDSLHRTLYRFHDRPVSLAPSLEELHGMLEGEWVSEGYRDPSEERTYLDHARQVLAGYHRDNAPDFRIPAESPVPKLGANHCDAALRPAASDFAVVGGRQHPAGHRAHAKQLEVVA